MIRANRYQALHSWSTFLHVSRRTTDDGANFPLPNIRTSTIYAPQTKATPRLKSHCTRSPALSTTPKRLCRDTCYQSRRHHPLVWGNSIHHRINTWDTLREAGPGPTTHSGPTGLIPRPLGACRSYLFLASLQYRIHHRCFPATGIQLIPSSAVRS